MLVHNENKFNPLSKEIKASIIRQYIENNGDIKSCIKNSKYQGINKINQFFNNLAVNLKTSLLKNKDKNIFKASLINITREDALKFLEIKKKLGN